MRHGSRFVLSLSGAYLVRHGEANYAFFEAVLDFYQQKEPSGKDPQTAADDRQCFRMFGRKGSPRVGRSGARSAPDKTAAAIRRKRRDLQLFTQSVFANQKRLVDNSYVPLDEQSVERLYREVY